MKTFSALLTFCEKKPPVTGGFASQGQWCRALMFSLICAWTNGWANTRDASDFRRHQAQYDVTVMILYRTRYVKETTRLIQGIEPKGLFCKFKRHNWRFGKYDPTQQRWYLDNELPQKCIVISSKWSGCTLMPISRRHLVVHNLITRVNKCGLMEWWRQAALKP